MSIICAVYTCGRREYLEATLASYRDRVHGAGRVVIFDDSGDPAYTDWLYSLGHSVASWGRNRGYTGSMQRSWDWLGTHAVEDHVFHLEEDFIFDRDIELADLVEVLEADQTLDQVALLRHAWFPAERRAGGIIAQRPDEHHTETIAGHDVITHTRVFTTNPSIYRRELCAEGWPQRSRSEAVFSARRRDAGRRFAYIGNGTPWCTHIGAERSGVGGY